MTGQDVVLSDEDVAIIKRIQSGQYPNADHDEYKVLYIVTLFLYHY